MADPTVYCLWCLRSHPAPVAVAVGDICPNSSRPDLMAALADSLRADSPASPRQHADQGDDRG